MIILKANKVNLFVSSVLFVFWYHSPNALDTPHICNISRLRVKQVMHKIRHEVTVFQPEEGDGSLLVNSASHFILLTSCFVRNLIKINIATCYLN
jgi:hypothetical protein